MSTPQNPIGGGPRDPFEKPLRVEPIEEDHAQERPKPYIDRSFEEKLSVAAYLIRLLRSAVDYFLSSSPRAKPATLSAHDNLTFLKNSLDTLKKEDRSQDVDFLNQLSRFWLQALDDSLHFSNEAISFKYKMFVKNIQHYPENQRHTFGYYLTENAQQKWVPFPYMELIQKIHSEHEKNPTQSKLVEWTSMLEELIALLKPD